MQEKTNQNDDQGKLEIAVRVLGNELVAMKMTVDDFKMKWLVIGVGTIVALFWAASAMGMGYFIFFIWKWVTETIDPVIGETMGTLIRLVDRVRMLDNDLIRLNSKLSMVLEYRAKLNPGRKDELQQLVDEYKSSGDQDAKSQ